MVSTAGCPPPDAFFTPSSSENDVWVVCVRVTCLSTKFRRVSVINPFHGAGAFDLSVLVARKSLLSAAIWLAICASEMFCAAVLKTTWTTTLIVAIGTVARWNADVLSFAISFSSLN